MATDVLVPQMGESVLEGTILEWKVKVGDRVEINQPLVELMTDKVNVEIPAETAGTIASLLVKEGEVVPVGNPHCGHRRRQRGNSCGSGGGAAPAPAVTTAPVAAKAPARDIKGTAEVGRGRCHRK